MTILLFSGDAGLSLIIRRGTDNYGEGGRRSKSEGYLTLDDLEPLNSRSVGGLNGVNLQPALDEVFYARS